MRQNIQYSEFKAKVIEALEEQPALDLEKYRKEYSIDEWPDENIDLYRLIVGSVHKKFWSEYENSAVKRHQSHKDWFHEIEYDEDNKKFSEAIANVSSNLRGIRADIRWAYGFHYRLHAENKKLIKHAHAIDSYLFGKPFELRGQTIFERVADSDPVAEDEPGFPYRPNELRSDINEIKRSVEQDIPAAVLHAVEILRAEIATAKEGETDKDEIKEGLIWLLKEIRQRDIFEEDIPQALVSAYRDVQELRQKLARLEALTNQKPEIIPYIEEAEKALQFGDDFSLKTVRESMSAATDLLFTMRQMQGHALQQTEESLSLILAAEAQIASAQFDHDGATEIYEQQIMVLKSSSQGSEGARDQDLANDLAVAHMNRGMALYYLSQYQAAIEALDKAIVIMGGLRTTLEAEGRYTPALAHDLARATMERGIVLAELLDQHAVTVEDYDQATQALVDLRARLDAEGYDNLVLSNDLPTAHIDWSNLLEPFQRYKAIVDVYDQAISMIGDLQTNLEAEGLFPPVFANNLAVAHTNRGIGLQKMTRPKAALKAHNRAIAIMIDLRSKLEADGHYPPAFANSLAKAHMGRGNALQGLTRHKAALKAYDKALAIMVDLQTRLGADVYYKPVFANDLARVHISRGSALMGLTRYNAARKVYDKAIAIMVGLRTKLEAEGRYPPAFANDLASAFFNRAILYAEAQLQSESCADARRAENLWLGLLNRLGETAPPQFTSKLSISRTLIARVCVE